MYFDLSKVLKSESVRLDALKYYPRYRFDKLYYKFNETATKPFESVEHRKEWKEIIQLFDKLNKQVWDLARFRRTVRNWNERNMDRLFHKIFSIERLVSLLYEKILGVSSEEEVVWRNYVLNLVYGVLVGEYNIKMSKDDIRELMPVAGLSAFRISLRQMFQPVLQLLNAIISDLENGNVDESKLKQLEDALLLKVLPWWYRIFEKSIAYS